MKTIYANLSFNSVIETEGWLIIKKTQQNSAKVHFSSGLLEDSKKLGYE